MAQPCSVCARADRAAVDAALAGGESLRVVAKRFGLSPTSLNRHKRNHAKVTTGAGIGGAFESFAATRATRATRRRGYRPLPPPFEHLDPVQEVRRQHERGAISAAALAGSGDAQPQQQYERYKARKALERAHPCFARYPGLQPLTKLTRRPYRGEIED